MPRGNPRRGLRRVLRLVTETGADLVEALADDGRLDPMEAATIGVRLISHLTQPDAEDDVPSPLPWTPRAAAWRELATAIRRGDRAAAHAALDRACGWDSGEEG
jgi:hypothetical protein